MMRREARWLGGLLGEYGHDLGQVLSVGSGTKDFRSVAQPWIEAEVFAPLSVRGVRVLHHELFPGDGVDGSAGHGTHWVTKSVIIMRLTRFLPTAVSTLSVSSADSSGNFSGLVTSSKVLLRR